jgi:hypothetical protein
MAHEEGVINDLYWNNWTVDEVNEIERVFIGQLDKRVLAVSNYSSLIKKILIHCS